MKHIFCFLLLVITSFSVKAQTEKGRWNTGLSVGSFTYESRQTGHIFSGSLGPSAGYFPTHNLLVGLGLYLGYSSSKSTSASTAYRQSNRGTNLGLTPFVRYYFGAAKIKPTVGLAYTYSLSNVRSINSLNTPEESTSKWRGMQLTPSAGLAYFINRTVSLDAQLGYNWSRNRAENIPGVSTIKNASLTIGFTIFFGQ